MSVYSPIKTHFPSCNWSAVVICWILCIHIIVFVFYVQICCKISSFVPEMISALGRFVWIWCVEWPFSPCRDCSAWMHTWANKDILIDNYHWKTNLIISQIILCRTVVMRLAVCNINRMSNLYRWINSSLKLMWVCALVHVYRNRLELIYCFIMKAKQ